MKLRHSVDSIYLSVSHFFYKSCIVYQRPHLVGSLLPPSTSNGTLSGGIARTGGRYGSVRRAFLLDFVTHPGASGLFAHLVELLIYADCHPCVYHLKHYGFGCYLPDLLSGMCFRGFVASCPRSEEPQFRGFDSIRTREYAH